MPDVSEIINLMRDPKKEDIERIKRALDFAEKAHHNQLRKSGEPYIIHPFETAKILAEFKADTDTIVAGLLHDTIEDSEESSTNHVTQEDIEKEFGKDVAFLVNGVTKLGKLKYRGVKRHTESLRKLFVAMAEDIRVIMIRLADRLHNVRTLQYVRPDKQKRIALETLEIYAPIANRLGIWRLKGMLEDAAFPFAFPEEYARVVALRKTKGKETIKRLEKVFRSLSHELAERGIKGAIIDYRIKYLYSLYTKLLRKNMDIDEIYDFSGIRIIVNTIEECYQVLGIVHSIYRPVPGRMKDYIASPKPNGYKSIHTSVFTGEGNIVEVQIRTKEMQYEAEYGVASHIYYSESGKPIEGGKISKGLEWIQELIEWQKHVNESDEFLRTLKTDFFKDRIFVFTPKGDVIELPSGSTPIDFAYAIHSDIGDHASAARINGKFMALDHVLKNGDIVEIEVKKTSRPTTKWLEHAKTNQARKHIISAIQKQEAKTIGDKVYKFFKPTK
jgi:GTP pyrophosphokinase